VLYLKCFFRKAVHNYYPFDFWLVMVYEAIGELNKRKRPSKKPGLPKEYL
jgi:hypothetical protein